MRDETLKYYINFLVKHEAKFVRIQAFYRGRLARRRMQGRIQVMRAVLRVGRRADERWRTLFSETGFLAFKATLYDQKGNKIPLHKKGAGGNVKGAKGAKKLQNDKS